MNTRTFVIVGLLSVLGCGESPSPTVRQTPAPTPSDDVSASAPSATASIPPPPPPSLPANANVLWISVDSLRADMPWLGYPRDVAPRLTALEKRCTSYSRAYAVASHTAPSLAAVLFGKYPTELDRDGHFSTAFSKKNLSFVKLLQDAQIKTISGHAHIFMNRVGFSQGFDRYDLVPGLKLYPNLDENITGKAMSELAQKQLTELGELGEDQRFLAWYHFLDPHAKWFDHVKDGLPSWGPKMRDQYDNEVTYADKYIGKLLDFVEEQPWAKRTLIVVTSDHGEALGELGQMYHGYEVWEHVIHVPLFFCGAGIGARHIDTPRSLIDLGPTLLEMFGQPIPADFRGQSLVPELLGGEAPAREVLIDLPANDFAFARRALIGERYKILWGAGGGGYQLFDLQEDPKEKKPIRKGEEYDAWTQKLKERARTLQEIKPYKCRQDCLKGW